MVIPFLNQIVCNLFHQEAEKSLRHVAMVAEFLDLKNRDATNLSEKRYVLLSCAWLHLGTKP